MEKNALGSKKICLPEDIVAHAKKQKRRGGKRPAAHFLGIGNPRIALAIASELIRLAQDPEVSFHAFVESVQRLFDKNGVIKKYEHLRFDERIIYFQPIRNLMERFEKDIQFGCHSLSIEFDRSEVGKELVRRGREVLGQIVEYLKKRNPAPGDSMTDDISVAWSLLICEIKKSLGGKPTDMKFGNLLGWVLLAEELST